MAFSLEQIQLYSFRRKEVKQIDVGLFSLTCISAQVFLSNHLFQIVWMTGIQNKVVDLARGSIPMHCISTSMSWKIVDILNTKLFNIRIIPEHGILLIQAHADSDLLFFFYFNRIIIVTLSKRIMYLMDVNDGIAFSSLNRKFW